MLSTVPSFSLAAKMVNPEKKKKKKKTRQQKMSVVTSKYKRMTPYILLFIHLGSSIYF
jgi:hypothetical protein